MSHDTDLGEITPLQGRLVREMIEDAVALIRDDPETLQWDREVFFTVLALRSLTRQGLWP